VALMLLAWVVEPLPESELLGAYCQRFQESLEPLLPKNELKPVEI